MTPIVFYFNIVLLLSHISAQWQAYCKSSSFHNHIIGILVVLGYLQVDGGAKYNFVDDLGLKDFQVQIIVGSVYTFTNGFANLFFGILADQYPRKWLWVGGCVLWTLCTLAESYSTTFTQLLLARIGFAFFMGSNIPLSVSLLSDYTMPKDRGLAQSLYAAGVYLGVGMSSISIIIDNAVG